MAVAGIVLTVTLGHQAEVVEAVKNLPGVAEVQAVRTGVLWVCENEQCLEHHKKWMQKSGRTCVMQIV